jgi:hypothetical protein
MFSGVQGIVQAGFVVDNLDRAIERWTVKGAGPFRAFHDIEVDLFYHGEPAKVRLNLALGQFDGVQIELMEPLSEAPSIYHDSFPDGFPEEGFHHFGMIADDYDRFVANHAAEGRPLALNGVFSGYRFGFVDTREQLGFMLEVFENTPALLEFFGEIKALRDSGASA